MENSICSCNIIYQYATTDEMEIKYYLRDPLMFRANPIYFRYDLVGYCE